MNVLIVMVRDVHEVKLMSFRATIITVMAWLSLSSIGTAAQSQQMLEQVSPTCQDSGFTCEDFDIYDSVSRGVLTAGLLTGTSIQANTIAKIMADGRITLDELFYSSFEDSMTPWGFEPLVRQAWLEMNGYDPNLSGDSWFPTGNVTTALASEVAVPLPEIAPACELNSSSCITIPFGDAFEKLEFDQTALFHLMIWRHIDDLDEWLIANGLEGSGVNLFSVVEGKTYSFDLLCNSCP